MRRIHATWLRSASLYLPLGALAALGVAGSFDGWGTDRDTIRVIQSAQALLHGHYRRSRSFGFPLHEVSSAFAYAIGGLLAVNLFSVLAAVSGVLLALRFVRIVDRERQAVVAAALCFSPMILANASAAIDFVWSLAAGMALLLAARRVEAGADFCAAQFSFAGWSLALLLIRPDNILFVAAICLALAGCARARFLGAAVAAACAAGTASCAYLLLNDPHALITGVTSTRPWPARVARGAVLLAASLGPGGALAVVTLVWPGHSADRRKLASRVAGWAWPLYLVRFVALPDQMEYLILPVETTILAACMAASQRRARVIALLVGIPGIITLAAFDRDKVTGAPLVTPTLQPGALVQDWLARDFAMRMEDPRMIALITSRIGVDSNISWHYDVFMPGYVSNLGDLVIGHEHLYRVMPGALGPATVLRDSYRSIFACNFALGPGIGWRGLEVPTAQDVLRAPADLRCWLAAPAPSTDKRP